MIIINENLFKRLGSSSIYVNTHSLKIDYVDINK